MQRQRGRSRHAVFEKQQGATVAKGREGENDYEIRKELEAR